MAETSRAFWIERLRAGRVTTAECFEIANYLEVARPDPGTRGIAPMSEKLTAAAEAVLAWVDEADDCPDCLGVATHEDRCVFGGLAAALSVPASPVSREQIAKLCDGAPVDRWDDGWNAAIGAVLELFDATPSARDATGAEPPREPCSACGGEPYSHASGKPCVCTLSEGRAGTMIGEVEGLRRECFRLSRAAAAEPHTPETTGYEGYEDTEMLKVHAQWDANADEELKRRRAPVAEPHTPERGSWDAGAEMWYCHGCGAMCGAGREVCHGYAAFDDDESDSWHYPILRPEEAIAAAALRTTTRNEGEG